MSEIARWERIAYYSTDADARSDARDHLCVLRPTVAKWSPDAATAIAEAEDEAD